MTRCARTDLPRCGSSRSGEGVGPVSPPTDPMTHDNMLTVSEVTRHVKRLLDSSELLQDISVRGEVSNFKRHTSGHLYFSLKDENCQLGCVMFLGAASHLRFQPEDGMQVIASGDVTVYERGGRYQLYTRFMQPDGLGDLHLAFERLKAKLEAEGLFDAARKRPIQRFPRRIAIITSPTGAAIRDLTTILARRYPAAAQLIVPAIVQGDEAARSIVRALAIANEMDRVDTIIVGRGGGSIEDLWAFNEEPVARAIYASARPVISAVGHETDFTIADFVADVRAPTPSAAAELAVPDQAELRTIVGGLAGRLRLALLGGLDQRRTTLAQLAARRALRFPAERIRQFEQAIDEFASRLERAYRHRLERLGSRTEALCDRLEALGPAQTLQRGYALCVRPADGALITRTRQLAVGDRLNVRFHDGTAGADVAELEETAK